MTENPIRCFTAEDIPAVADLHRRVFRVRPKMDAALLESYTSYFRSIFLDSPFRDPRLDSLVCQENGAIVGFLGVTARPLRFQGSPVLAAVTSQFVVDPASRSMAGVRLLKACFDGPQDLTFADESTDPTRRLWETLGGKTSYAHSFRWLSVLRPGQLVLSTAAKLAPVTGLLRPPVRILDWAAVRVPRGPYRLPRPSALSARPFTGQDLTNWIASERAPLASVYDVDLASWTLGRLENLRELHGPVRAVRVDRPGGKMAGYYIYHRKPRGVSRVVDFRAAPGAHSDVLTHLLYDAWQGGCLALGGRIHPTLQHVFARLRFLMDDNNKWFLAHSRSPELLAAVRAGDDNLSPLDGEWTTHFNFGNRGG